MPRPLMFLPALLSALACHHRISDDEFAEMSAPLAEGACAVKSDTVIAKHAVGPSAISWKSECLPGAALVYVDRERWDIFASGPLGENPVCLTCLGDNALGVNFPLDEDGQGPTVHWKGDPEAHPTLPIVFFKAENEHSGHVQLANSPSIGVDNDLWALNVCTKRYTRLTQQAPKEGLQHSAMSDDGALYVYPQRYAAGKFLNDFGKTRMVFNRLAVDPATQEPALTPVFNAIPQGEMYYEPLDIQRLADGRYRLNYVAGDGTMLDPYAYEWSGEAPGESRALAATPRLHEEFLMFSPSGKKLVWMRGPLVGLGYRADLFLSDPELNQVSRLTFYNNCNRAPEVCKDAGAQLSRLDWSDDGRALYFGLWIHDAPLRPFAATELHRLEFEGACGAP